MYRITPRVRWSSARLTVWRRRLLDLGGGVLGAAFLTLWAGPGAMAEERAGIIAPAQAQPPLSQPSVGDGASRPAGVKPLRGTAGSELIENGEVLIQRIDLRGKVFYPDYGITKQVISDWVEQTYGQQDPWLSVAEMHRLADSLTSLYREKGLAFAQVYVVPQEIVDGRLVLNVLVGVLSEVDIYDNSLYSKEQLLAPFHELLGRELYEPEIVATIASLNRRPGLKVFGIFSMGSRYGETRLNLRVRKEVSHQTLLRADNFGVEQTGAYRVMLQHVQNDLFNDAGALQATLMQTSESGNLFGGLSYFRPVGLRHSVTASAARSQFEVAGDFAELGLTGYLDAATLGWGYDVKRSEAANTSIGLNLAGKRSRVSSAEFKSLLEQEVQYATFTPSLQLARLASSGRLHQGVELSALLGTVTSGGEQLEDSAFWVLGLGYRLQYAWPFGSLDQTLALSLTAQYSPDPLPSAERRSLTGGQAVRGYDAGLFSSDSSYLLTLNQTLAAWKGDSGWSARPFVFIDHAFGKLNDDQGNWARYTAAGLGVEGRWSEAIRGGLSWGFPLEQAAGLDLGQEAGGSVLYGHLGYHF